MCQWSQGEVTNMSVLASTSQSDLEIVDVGSRDDILRLVSNLSQSSLHSSNGSDINGANRTSDIISKKKKSKSSVQEKTLNKLKQNQGDTVKTLTEKRKLNVQLFKKRKDLKNKDILLVNQKEKMKDKLDKIQNKDTLAQLTTSKTGSGKLKNVLSEVGKKKKKLITSKAQESMTEGEVTQYKEGKDRGQAWSWDGEGVVKKVTNIVSDCFIS